MTTILCSNYNSSSYINNYLNYVNNQMLNNFDIVFVDANSNDGSLETIKNYNFRNGINKKIIEFKTKICLYEAWNEAILACSTPYVMNYNTDDCLYPTALLVKQSYALMHPSVDVFYSPCFVSSDKDHKNVIRTYMWSEYSHESLLRGCFIGPYPYLKKKTIVDQGLFDPRFTISGDYEMWLRLSKNKKSFFKIKEILGCYYQNPVGLSTENTEQRAITQSFQDFNIRNLHK